MSHRVRELSGGGAGGWTITRKLLALIVTVVVGFAILAAIQYRTVEQVRIEGPAYKRIIAMNDLVADILPPPEYVIEAYLLVQQLVEEKSPQQREELVAQLGQRKIEYDERHQVWVNYLQGPEYKPLRDAFLVEAYQPAVEFFRIVQTQFIPAIQAGDRQQAYGLAHGVLRRYYNQHRRGIDKTVQLAKAQKQAEEATAAQLLLEGHMSGIPVATALLLLVVIFGGVLSHQIRRSLQETASTLSTFSAQLAATIEEQERATAVQAAAVNETTATMEELSSSFQQASTVAQNASEHARHALALASGTNGHGTLEGGAAAGLQEKIRQVTQDLLRLGEQTSQIDAITRAVSDIAGQTNMLALNAAVEAARAGENGRGFAVVAAEVRKLADESRKSAERSLELLGEIEKATTATVLSMEQGTKAVDEVARALEHLQQASQQAALNIQQQLGAVHQVTSAMGDLSNSAHETAAGVAQTRSGIRTLQERADALSGMV